MAKNANMRKVCYLVGENSKRQNCGLSTIQQHMQSYIYYLPEQLQL